MMTLFDQPPYQSHSATSIEASDSMKGKTARIRDLVLASIRESDATDDELFGRFPGYSPNTIRPRRVELLARGLVEPAGRRVTSSGRSATVWQSKAAS